MPHAKESLMTETRALDELNREVELVDVVNDIEPVAPPVTG